MPSQPIFVLGMHRSGTTLVITLLKRLGLFIGEDRDRNNETRCFLMCNEIAMRSVGSGWDTPLNFATAMQDKNLTDHAYHAMIKQCSSALQKTFLGNLHYPTLQDIEGMWAVKDPRFTFTLPLWERYFQQPITLIYIERHGVDVAASLAKRHLFIMEKAKEMYHREHFAETERFFLGLVSHTPRCLSLESSFTLWEEYLTQAHSLLANRPLSYTIRYEELLENPLRTLQKLCEFLRISPEKSTLNTCCDSLDATGIYRYRHHPNLIEFAKNNTTTLERYGYSY